MTSKKTSRLSPRPYGQILLDLEVLYNEALEDHDVQLGDLMYGLYGWAQVHTISKEVYVEDGSSPVFYYGHKEGLIKLAQRAKGTQDES